MNSDQDQDRSSDPPEWVTLVSQDNYRFVVDYRCAIASGTIKNMLAGEFAEAQSHTCKLHIRGVVLEKVIEYLLWKTKYADAKDGDIPDFQNRIPPEIALELLMSADFLEV